MSLAITETITTIAEAERRFQLLWTEEEAFFPEWWTALPPQGVTEQLKSLLYKAHSR